MIAGFISEVLFDADNLSFGSSLAEQVIFRTLGIRAAGKMGRNCQEVLFELVASVGRVLHRRETVVRHLASELDRYGSVGGKRLERILAPVRQARAP